MFNERESDALKEILNIGVGRSAAAINEMVGAHVSLHIPALRILTPNQVELQLSDLGWDNVSYVTLDFRGGFRGHSALVFPKTSASTFVSILTGDSVDASSLDSIRAATLTEIGNIVLNSVLGSISNCLDEHFQYSIPVHHEASSEPIMGFGRTLQDVRILLAETRFSVESHDIEGEVLIFLELDSWEYLLRRLDLLLTAV